MYKGYLRSQKQETLCNDKPQRLASQQIDFPDPGLRKQF